MLRRKPHPVGLRNILVPAALFLALVPWIGLQNATGLFADAANPAWKMAGDAIGASLAGSISVNRDLTAAALLRLITAAAVFWLALQLCRDAGRARALVGAIALIGAAYAAYRADRRENRLVSDAGDAARRRRVGDVYQPRFLCGLCRDRVPRDDRYFPAAVSPVRRRRSGALRGSRSRR